MDKVFSLIMVTILFMGCSHSVIVKDCKKVDDNEYSVCRSIKPWE